MSDFETRGAAAPNPPWHMWGSSVPLDLNVPGPHAAGSVLFPNPVQVFAIRYRRPETWSMLFYAFVNGGNVSDVNIDLVLNFNLIWGVGRTALDTAGTFGSSTAFCEMRFRILAGVVPGQIINKKWTTEVFSPPLDDTALATSVHPIQWIPGEDIQCSVRAAMIIGGATAVDNRITAEAGAWMAPRTHVRPDWFADVDEASAFLGSETKGT